MPANWSGVRMRSLVCSRTPARVSRFSPSASASRSGGKRTPVVSHHRGLAAATCSRPVPERTRRRTVRSMWLTPALACSIASDVRRQKSPGGRVERLTGRVGNRSKTKRVQTAAVFVLPRVEVPSLGTVTGWRLVQEFRVPVDRLIGPPILSCQQTACRQSATSRTNSASRRNRGPRASSRFAGSFSSLLRRRPG